MRGLSLLFAVAAALQAADISTALAPLTGDEILFRLIEHNRQRESLLRGYSVQRAYSATNRSGKLYAAKEVRMSYAAPDEKTFVTLSSRGSWLVRDLVFSRLMQTEAAAARGKERNDSSMAPANYRFEALGAGEVGGRPCYVVQRCRGGRDCSHRGSSSEQSVVLDSARRVRPHLLKGGQFVAAVQGRDGCRYPDLWPQGPNDRPPRLCI
jgi:hypothetical protein